ncbi:MULTISPECIES: response regulator transcription factor [Variovorax]|jgi:two-component system, OmpR family, response regulator TctD|uniref:response regulator transcription factor n=1 Tax=Variovorax TaxID=34072 RepID=UPI00086A46B0|nr:MULTISPECIES: response regulator transcription factor [Variovorax]MBN8752324.1 response regulator transcription factor [Variovorax sp.]ODU18197.1 MAG: two-component system response regulator [Variovorax sp. SCN 67-85]ODV26796.1 MAG: two-component system response regulator [Variovorax sp. SCN 67-20]OJZ08886.1 MAG: two-component system response regulator [Variovorax sp. 67-131]UKI11349.1 response regulator transcription factor [Variovorax paradoxus]
MKLLLVEDDPSMQITLQRTLGRQRIDVRVCGDGAEAVTMWRALEPDVVALDLSLPNLDGLQVLAQARAEGLRTPVLLLTARGTVGDRIMGLNAGADDYLPKPFDLDELEARIRALRRRSHGVMTDMGLNPQQIGGLRFEPANGAIYNRAELLELTPRELALLKALMMKPGHAVTKERLFELVFPGETEVQYEAIEVVVYRLRKKLVGTGAVLMTMRGLGYLLRPEA